MYWLYYALPLFWGDRLISDVYVPIGREIPDEALTQSLTLVLLGVLSLWVGMNSKLGGLLSPKMMPQLALDSRLNYVRSILLLGSLLSFYEPSIYIFGPDARQVLAHLISTVPLLAFAIVFRLYLKGESIPFDKGLLFTYFFVRVLSGLSSGWLGVLMSIVIISAAVYIVECKKMPRAAIVLVVLVTLFFQVGKEDFRRIYWKENQQAGQFERASYWLQTSLDKWSNVVTDPNGANVRQVINPSISRVSLLTQTANVINQTPSAVPYQYGRLYSYLAVTLIPRFVWPDKPSINEANQFYQVAYGLTKEAELEDVSISVGVLTEGYMNFGWLGVIGVMFLLGVFFEFYQKTFLSESAGLLMGAIGLLLLVQFLSIELQMAQYLGGIVQQVLLSLFAMLPVVRLRLRRKSSVRPLVAN